MNPTQLRIESLIISLHNVIANDIDIQPGWVKDDLEELIELLSDKFDLDLGPTTGPAELPCGVSYCEVCYGRLK